MTTATMTLTEFLLARVADDEAAAERARPLQDYMPPGAWDLDRVLAECEVKRRIVEFHKSWPVLVETPPKFEQVQSVGGNLNQFAMRASQQVAWMTEQEYRTRFGSEPPTVPMLRGLASVYADHPDYRDEWRP